MIGHSHRIDAALDRDPRGPMTIREKIVIASLASVGVIAGSLLVEARLPDHRPPGPVCPSEDEVLLAVEGDQFEFGDGQPVCVHLDAVRGASDG